MLNKITLLALALLLGFSSSQPLSAQLFKKKEKAPEPTEQSDEKKEEGKKDKKDDKDILKTCVKSEGLFEIQQDTTNGTTYLGIKEDQIGKEYIYFSYTENGPIWAGHVRGMFRGNKVFKIRKHYERIEFVTQNTQFYFDEDAAISKAKDANISEAIMVSAKIEKTDKDSKTHYIKADDLFLTEKIQKIQRTPPSGPMAAKMFKLGKLSKDKSKYKDIRNYPKNTDIIVDYVYENPMPQNRGGNDITDARYNTITYQHSIIEMPDNDYQPRYDDSRVGFFTQRVTDMTSTSYTPYRDLINRWHLVKKNPEAPISEPVEPITWWIENTTPKAFRPIIKEAVEKWNIAFEQAGFKNAVVVKIQPDDAEWDAGDIRYNVLRWTSSPYPPWGGYGPSFVNPRTGQILGADIMLELAALKGDIFQSKLYGAGGSSNVECAGIPHAILSHESLLQSEDTDFGHQNCCAIGGLMQINNIMGMTYLKSGNEFSEEQVSDLVREALHYLALHEVGHTLGLNHNMKATNLHSPRNAHKKDLTEKVGLYGSVMDYPDINLASDRSKQGNYFTTTPGPYDLWAIEFGYSTALEGEMEEQKRLDEILERSTQAELMFGNDADDMRAPGKGIDPRVMIFDFSNDPIKHGEERVRLIKDMLPELKDKFTEDGQSYQELLVAYNVLTGNLYSVFSTASRFVGGIYVDRAVKGQEGATKPYTPVPYAQQKKAMNLLTKHLFSPTAFDEPNEIYNYLQRQRRGFDFFSRSEDPKLHDRFAQFPNAVISHLLHPNVLRRLTDSQLYGNEYSVFEMTNDLTNAIFKGDGGEVNTYRQNMQIDYVKKLLASLKSTAYDDVAKSSLLYQVKEIEKMVKGNQGGGATKAHRMHMAHLIEMAMKGK